MYLNRSTHSPATLEELSVRVSRALERNPLCKDVEFTVIKTPLRADGANWTISMQSDRPRGMWEAAEIVRDIQEAYVLAEPR